MFNLLARLRAKKGFTIVELIVVIAIIGVLSAIIVPALMYDNKPAVGKSIAKDAFYQAQDVMTDLKMVTPDALASTTYYYVYYSNLGQPAAVGKFAPGSAGSAIKVDTDLLTTEEQAKFTVGTPSNAEKTIADGLMSVMTSISSDMKGFVVICVDKNLRVDYTYWSNVEDLTKIDGDFTAECALSTGFYCCAFPIKYSEEGAELFEDPMPVSSS